MVERVLLAFVVLLAGGGQASAVEGARLPATMLKDSQGRAHAPGDWNSSKAVVLFFLGTECPVSNGYCPEMARLQRKYADRGVVFLGIHPDPDVDGATAAKHSKEYRLPFPVLLDPGQVWAGAARVKVVPEAVLLSPAGEVLYHGRIDDRYTADGKRREVIRSRDLEQAVEAHLAGKPLPRTETKAFGCPLPMKIR